MKEQNVPANPGCIRRVVIVGGGTAGWMTASALGRYLKSDAPEIILLESSDIATVGVGEATIPSITKFHRALGLDERKLLAATGATFKLGIEFVDWQNIGDRYFHPFGLFGKDVGGVGFHNLYLKISKSVTYDDAWRYSPCAVAAASGRFGPQAANNAKPTGGFPHAFHLDAKLYAAHLRDYAEAKGVFRVEGRVVEVVRRKENGFVQSVVLQDGRTIDGDLFIDCTGGRGLLIGDAMGVDYLDWRDSLPCNRAVVVPSKADSTPALYTRATAKPAGWQWRIPLQHRCGNGYVYSSDHVSDDAAAQELLNDVSDRLETPRILTFRTGRRAEFWRGNVVAIGLSAGFLEPLESTSIHLIQTGVSKLLNLFPDKTFSRALAAEYNKTMINAFEGVRDFIILHYKATKRTDTTFWDRVREMPIPTSLRDRVELFRESGRFVRDENELFSLESWILVMLGQGIVPERYSPLVDAIDDVLVNSAEKEIRAEIADAVRSMPTHEVYLRSLSKTADA